MEGDIHLHTRQYTSHIFITGTFSDLETLREAFSILQPVCNDIDPTIFKNSPDRMDIGLVQVHAKISRK